MNVMKYIKLYHILRNLNFIKSNFGIFSVLQLLICVFWCLAKNIFCLGTVPTSNDF